MKWRITHISDTHNKHNKVITPGGDILIHSGDISSIGRKHEVLDFIKWFSKQPYKFKIFIAGNHDLTFDSEVLFRDKSVHFDHIQYDLSFLHTMLQNSYLACRSAFERILERSTGDLSLDY
jgi:3',5'-cyclic AMP phosphodiesterase CpdA